MFTLPPEILPGAVPIPREVELLIGVVRICLSSLSCLLLAGSHFGEQLNSSHGWHHGY
jgi:hypothetical protein